MTPKSGSFNECEHKCTLPRSGHGSCLLKHGQISSESNVRPLRPIQEMQAVVFDRLSRLNQNVAVYTADEDVQPFKFGQLENAFVDFFYTSHFGI